MDFSSCVWNTGYIQDLKLLESVQRRFTKAIDSFKDLDYKTRLQNLSLFSVKGRLLRADLIKCWKIFHGESCIKPDDIFTLSSTSNLRGHPFKIFQHHTETEIRKRFFSNRIISMWNSLPTQVVTQNSLNSFKHALHDHLGDILFEFHE